MAANLSVEIDERKSRQYLDTLKAISPKKNPRIFNRSLTRMMLTTQERIKRNAILRRGTGPPVPRFLTNRSGGRGLIGSIGINKTRLPNFGIVFTDSPYGPIHEEGGTFRFRGGRVRSYRVKAHRRKGVSKIVKAHTVDSFFRGPRTATYPRRRFMGLGLDLAQPQFPRILFDVVEAEARKA